MKAEEKRKAREKIHIHTGLLVLLYIVGFFGNGLIKVFSIFFFLTHTNLPHITLPPPLPLCSPHPAPHHLSYKESHQIPNSPTSQLCCV